MQVDTNIIIAKERYVIAWQPDSYIPGIELGIGRDISQDSCFISVILSDRYKIQYRVFWGLNYNQIDCERVLSSQDIIVSAG